MMKTTCWIFEGPLPSTTQVPVPSGEGVAVGFEVGCGVGTGVEVGDDEGRVDGGPGEEPPPPLQAARPSKKAVTG
jgi:hypothetical protein